MPAVFALVRRARWYGTHQQRLPEHIFQCLMRCETADCVMHSFCAARSILVHVSPHPVPVMFCSPGVYCCCLLLVNAFSCTMTQFCVGCIYRSRRRVTFVSMVKRAAKRSGICAIAFRLATSRPGYVNGVALLPLFAPWSGIPRPLMLYLPGERGCPPLRDILWMSNHAACQRGLNRFFCI